MIRRIKPIRARARAAIRTIALGGALALAPASGALAEPIGGPRARGLERFIACGGPDMVGIPECLRAPTAGGPRPGPVGILLDDPAPIAACFDADQPPSLEIIEAVNQAMLRLAAEADGGVSNRFVLQNRWQGTNNAPITLTWSFIPDGITIPTGVDEPAAASELFAQMDAKFVSVGGRAAWIAQFESVFARWSQLTGVNYQRVTVGSNPWDDGASWSNGGAAGLRGDIRIGMKPIDGAFGVLAYNGYPSAGDMVLDSAENWAGTANSFRYLRNTIAHEHGHGLGLAHVCPRNSTKLMEPFLATAFDGPQQDDVRAVQRSYGDPFEPNNSTSLATNLGVLSAGAVLAPSEIPAPAVANAALTSLAVNGDVDHYLFTVSSPLVAAITVTPVGSLYADYVQDSSCNNSAANTDARAQADLALDVLNAGGSVLYTASAGGFAAAESLSGVLLSPGVNYFVRVREVNSPTEPQSYTLTMSGAVQPFQATDGSLADRVRLTWSPILSAANYSVFRSTSTNRASATLLVQTGSSTLQHDDTTAVAGTTYYYWLEATTNGTSGLRAAAGPESGFRANVPSNDTCVSATSIAAGQLVPFITTLATSVGPTESDCFAAGSAQIDADVWFTYTPAVTGPFTVRTCGSQFDTRIAVYAGACPSAPDTAAACGDDAPGCGETSLQSSVRVVGLGGTVYRIRVGGTTGAAGSGQVRVHCAADYNFTGDVTVQDIFDFLAAYFSAASDADFNASGQISVQDIFDFLAAYFAGC